MLRPFDLKAGSAEKLQVLLCADLRYCLVEFLLKATLIALDVLDSFLDAFAQRGFRQSLAGLIPDGALRL